MSWKGYENFQRFKILIATRRLKVAGHGLYFHSSPSPGPEVIKLFSCSAQLRLKFILLINVKMPTIVGILTFMSRINYKFLSFEPEFSNNFDYFSIYEQLKFHAQLS